MYDKGATCIVKYLDGDIYLFLTANLVSRLLRTESLSIIIAWCK